MDDLSDQARLALNEMTWVRRFARALVRDEATADDLAQEAWLIASEKAPAEGRRLQPWLSRVVLNLVRMHARSTKRRERREVATIDAAPPVATPEELVAQVEIQRVVATEVLALNEPYRSTVLLHYIEGLSSAEIARRLQIPDGTVRRRLKVALDEVRARLRAREDGPRGGWLAAFVPFCGMPAPEPSPSTPAKGGIALVATFAIAVALIAVIVWVRHKSHSMLTDSSGATKTTAKNGLFSTSASMMNVPTWLVQPDVAPRRVAGKVTFEGRAVAGASVRLTIETFGAPAMLIDERTTLPDGTFDFGVQPATTFVVSAQAVQRTSVAASVDVANPQVSPDHVVIDLDDCSSRLTGTVRDASGGAIVRARLTVAGLAGTISDQDGAYALCIQPAGHVRVAADGYGSVEIPTWLFDGELHYDFTLVPESTIVGQVVDQANGPVANARITVTPDGSEGPHALTSEMANSDTDGHFRVAGVGPGMFRVAAVADRVATDVPTVVFAHPGNVSKEIRLVVVSRTRIHGHVLLEGKPVAGARVGLVDNVVRRSFVGDPGPTSVSQADGSFTLDAAPRGTFDVVASPYEVKSPTSIAVEGAAVEVSIEVLKLASIRGRVTRHGKPVPNAEVRYFRLDPRTSVRTDQDGAFLFEGVPPGKGRLWAVSTTAKSYGFRDLTVSAMEDQSDVDVELGFAGEVKGRVVDEDARPVPGVYVRLFSREGDEGWSITNSNGDFDCYAMLGGDYAAAVYPTPALQQAFAAASGEKSLPVHVRDGEDVVTGVELAIKRQQLVLRGRVVDDAGVPVPDCHVQALGGDEPPRTVDGFAFDPPSTMTAADGNFEITNLAPGRYSVVAHSADGGYSELMGIAAGTTMVKISVGRPGVIEGDFDGFASPPSVSTVWRTEDLLVTHAGIVDGDHHFAIRGLPPGMYPVAARAGDQTDGQLVEVRADETTHVSLRPRSWVTIEGRFLGFGADGGIAGAVCHAIEMSSSISNVIAFPRSLPTDSTGHFSVSSPTGRVRVICEPSRPTVSVGVADVDVGSDGVPKLEVLTFPRAPSMSDPGFELMPQMDSLTVMTIDPGGPAAASGLIVGDRIVSIDGFPVTWLPSEAAMVLMRNRLAGIPLRLSVERAGTSYAIQVVPAPRPL